MRRKELTGFLVVGVIVLVAAIFAARWDLASLLFAETPATPQPKQADADARAPAARPEGQAAAAEESRPAAETRSALAAPQVKSAPEPTRAPGQAAKASAEPGRLSVDTKPASAAEMAQPARAAPPRETASVSESSKFDVVRIDPEGASVFAGRAPANARVTVLANEQPVASATANANGEWSTVIERPFPSGEYKLSLRAKAGGQGPETTGQSVRITIAASPPRPAATETKLAAPARAEPAPAPITFVYDEDTFTERGRKEAAALTEFLRQRRLETVTLSGHADSRGSDEYNMALSRRRLESVARFLRESGYRGKLVLEPKGKREPFSSPARDGLAEEDAFQLDRRVELRASP